MKELASFIIESITGSKDFSIEEEAEGERVTLIVKANPEIVGLIIGREGKTIKNIRKVVAIKAALENKILNITINDSASEELKTQVKGGINI